MNFHPTLPFFACGSKDSRIYIYSTKDFQLINKFNLSGRPINTVNFHPKDELLIFGGDDNKLYQSGIF